MERITRMAAALACASALVLAAGCAAEGDAPESVADDCVPDFEFDTIQDGVLIVAGFNSQPKFYAPSDQGPFTGIDAEFVSQFAAANCLEVDFRPMTGPAAQLETAQGNTDLMAGLIFKSDARAEVLGQSEGWIVYEVAGITSAAENAYSSLDDLEGLVVGAISGSSYVPPLKELFGDANVREFQTDNAVFEDLRAGRIDAAFWQSMQGNWFSSSDDGYVTEFIEDDPDYPELTAVLETNWPHTKDHPDLTAAIDAFYVQVKEDGTVERVLAEYGVEGDLYLQGR